jgi:hypothetical protein
MAFDGTNVWVSNYLSNSVMKLSPVGGAVVATYTGVTQPGQMAFDGTSMWIATGATGLKKMSLGGTVSGTPLTTETVQGLVFDGQHIWAGATTTTVYKLLASTTAVIATINLGTGGARGMAFDGVNVWVTLNGQAKVRKI